MGKRMLILMGTVVAIVLLTVGVAAAAGGSPPGDDVSPSTSAGIEEVTEATVQETDTTAVVTDTTEAVTETMVPTEEPGTVDEEPTTTTEFEDGDQPTDTSEVHPDNFGRTISSLRHEGDHTPAAVLKGKSVPGWTKKHGTTTTTQTTEPPASPEG